MKDILEGRLAPGQQLVETALASEYGVSRTPIREALQLLVKDGLVSISGGLRVCELTLKEVRDLLQTTQVLQGLSCRLAVMRGTSVQLENLEAVMVDMERAATSGDEIAWKAADQRLHVHISEMADNPSLSRMVRQMEFLIGRVRHLAIHLPGRMTESNVEHRRVVEAIKSRNADLAERAIRDHLAHVEELLLGILENFVVPFKGDRF
jgi:DNA-binding GntR family transcriptional regulator